jgi:hypothetical protein
MQRIFAEILLDEGDHEVFPLLNGLDLGYVQYGLIKPVGGDDGPNVRIVSGWDEALSSFDCRIIGAEARR